MIDDDLMIYHFMWIGCLAFSCAQVLFLSSLVMLEDVFASKRRRRAECILPLFTVLLHLASRHFFLHVVCAFCCENKSPSSGYPSRSPDSHQSISSSVSDWLLCHQGFRLYADWLTGWVQLSLCVDHGRETDNVSSREIDRGRGKQDL